MRLPYFVAYGHTQGHIRSVDTSIKIKLIRESMIWKHDLFTLNLSMNHVKQIKIHSWFQYYLANSCLGIMQQQRMPLASACIVL